MLLNSLSNTALSNTCSCAPRIATFGLIGQLNNHLRQLENVMFWARHASYKIMLHPELLRELNEFELPLSACPWCLVGYNATQPHCVIPQRESFHIKTLVNFTVSEQELREHRIQLYRALFALPKPRLLQGIGCALTGLRMHVSSWACKHPVSIAFERAAIQYAALHLRGLDGSCEKRLKHHNISTEACNMDPVWVQQQLSSMHGPCTTMPLYIATDWQRPHRVRLLVNSSTRIHVMDIDKRHMQQRKNTKTWSDILMLAMAQCTILNPGSSFSTTVDALKVAFFYALRGSSSPTATLSML